MTMRLRKRSSQAGFMIVLVLTAIAAVAVVTVLVLNQYKQRTKNNVYTTATFQGTMITNRLAKLVQDDNAWKHTLYLGTNTTFACLLPPYSSCVTPGRTTFPGGGSLPIYNLASVGTAAFKLTDESGVSYYDSTSATAGFDKVGNVCNSFDSVSGNDQCPFRGVLYWVADPITCASYPPICSKFTVYGYVLYKPKTTSQYQVPYFVGLDKNTSIPVHSFSVAKTTLGGSNAYCCTVPCLHTTGDGATAFIAQPIYVKSNCYAGSSEIGNDICDRTITNDAGDSEWTPITTDTVTWTSTATTSGCP